MNMRDNWGKLFWKKPKTAALFFESNHGNGYSVFPREYPLDILASDRKVAYPPFRNLLMIFGGWEFYSRPPKMTNSPKRVQERFFSEELS